MDNLRDEMRELTTSIENRVTKYRLANLQPKKTAIIAVLVEVADIYDLWTRNEALDLTYISIREKWIGYLIEKEFDNQSK